MARTNSKLFQIYEDNVLYNAYVEYAKCDDVGNQISSTYYTIASFDTFYSSYTSFASAVNSSIQTLSTGLSNAQLSIAALSIDLIATNAELSSVKFDLLTTKTDIIALSLALSTKYNVTGGPIYGSVYPDVTSPLASSATLGTASSMWYQIYGGYGRFNDIGANRVALGGTFSQLGSVVSGIYGTLYVNDNDLVFNYSNYENIVPFMLKFPAWNDTYDRDGCKIFWTRNGAAPYFIEADRQLYTLKYYSAGTAEYTCTYITTSGSAKICVTEWVTINESASAPVITSTAYVIS